MVAPRPLPVPPVQGVVLEGRKRSKRSTESRKASVAAASTSVSSSKDGLGAQTQVRTLPHTTTV